MAKNKKFKSVNISILIGVLLITTYFSVGVITLNDYGLTWDDLHGMTF